MSQPNPLLPQGAESPKPRVQSSIRIAVVTILTIHAALFAGLLMQGCKPEPKTADAEPEPQAPFAFDPPAPPGPGDGFADGSGVIVPPPAPIPQDGVPVIPPSDLLAPVPPSGDLAMNNAVIPPPPVAPPIPEPPVSEARTHTVAKGEFIETIAKQYGVSSAAVLAANPSVDPRRMQIGTKLVIPSASDTASVSVPMSGQPTLYVVKSGDNLTKIAKQHSVTINQLRTANGLKTDRLTVGQKLKIPVKMAAEPAGVPTAGGTPPPPVPPAYPEASAGSSVK